MRKSGLFLFAVLLALFLLNACSEDNPDTTRVTDYYSGLTKMTVQAAVSAEYSGYAVDFELSFVLDDQGKSFVEVKKPEEIAGIKVFLNNGEKTLNFAGMTVDVGTPEETVISPVEVLPELLRVWQDGIIFEQGKEKVSGTDCVMITYKSNKGNVEVLYRTWFDAESLKPVQADIYADGNKKMSCIFLIAENFK